MEFEFTSRAQRVIFGAGELERLDERLSLGRRVLLCTSGSYARNGVAARVRAALGARLVAVFDAVRPHVPDDSVAVATRLAADAGADVVLGLGGGSALGTAKAVALELLEQDSNGGVVHVAAIPTTYAGSEMTPLFGVTRVAEGRKVTVTDPRILPALVLYDPTLTLDLPPDLTAGTGVNALAHCVEGVYSLTRSPISTATALAGAAAIVRALPRCMAAGADLEARTELLTGAYLGGATIAHARLALHHGLCHVLGGGAGVPHGVANAIMLPHVMRFNLPACAPELASVARALGVATAGLADREMAISGIERIEALIGSLGLPRRLRDAGVAQADLPRLASLALQSAAVRANPRPITDAAEVQAVFRAAW